MNTTAPGVTVSSARPRMFIDALLKAIVTKTMNTLFAHEEAFKLSHILLKILVLLFLRCLQGCYLCCCTLSGILLVTNEH